MGRSAKKIDPLFHPPRNVWDDKGHLVGTYFPATQIIRLTEGNLLPVDSSGEIRRPGRKAELLDRISFVLKPVLREE